MPIFVQLVHWHSMQNNNNGDRRSLITCNERELEFEFYKIPVHRGYSKNLGSPWIRPRSLSPKFFMDFCSDGPYLTYLTWLVNVSAKFAVRGFTGSCDNSNCSFGLGCEPSILGNKEAVGGRGWYRSKEHRWVPIGPITFHLSLRVSEILSLLCSRMPLFPTPPRLPQNFSCFPGNRWMAFGLRRAKLLG